MIEVAKANGFDSITAAISAACKYRKTKDALEVAEQALADILNNLPPLGGKTIEARKRAASAFVTVTGALGTAQPNETVARLEALKA